MREVTDEMIEAFGEAWNRVDSMDVHGEPRPGERRRAGLEAVFALIERDSPTAAVNPAWAARQSAMQVGLDEEIVLNREAAHADAGLIQHALDNYVTAMTQGQGDLALAAATMARGLITREQSTMDRLWVLEDRKAAWH